MVVALKTRRRSTLKVLRYVATGVLVVAALVAAVVGDEAGARHVGDRADRAVGEVLRQVERDGRELDLVVGGEATGDGRRLATGAGRARSVTAAASATDIPQRTRVASSVCGTTRPARSRASAANALPCATAGRYGPACL